MTTLNDPNRYGLSLTLGGGEIRLLELTAAYAAFANTGHAVRPSLILGRGCGFVEKGSAFVSWDGGMHPCYHLWHQCRSFANGWLHPVQSRAFGSVAEKGISEIWNSKEFRTYRENVLRHDYPTCSSCNCSPCDLVQKEEFGQDCYANGEPCGSCLWSSGVFRCLD